MTTILLILTVLALVVRFAMPSKSGGEDLAGVKRTLKFCGSVFFLLAILFESYTTVQAGYRGVLLRFGAVAGDLAEGPHLVVPFVESVVPVAVQTQKEEAQASAASKDLQTVTTQVAINYHIDPMAVGTLYKNVGLTYPNRIIDPAVQETVKAVVAQYTAEELIRLRANVKAELDAKLTARLSPYNIVVENQGISLKNFDFSAAFNASIEAKQIAQQTAEKAKYVLQQAQIDAETKITEAKGQAEASRVTALALNSQGGQKVLERMWIEAWEKGGSQVPQVVSGNSPFMLNLSDLKASSNEQPQAKR